MDNNISYIDIENNSLHIDDKKNKTNFDKTLIDNLINLLLSLDLKTIYFNENNLFDLFINSIQTFSNNEKEFVNKFKLSMQFFINILNKDSNYIDFMNLQWSGDSTLTFFLKDSVDVKMMKNINFSKHAKHETLNDLIMKTIISLNQYQFLLYIGKYVDILSRCVHFIKIQKRIFYCFNGQVIKINIIRLFESNNENDINEYFNHVYQIEITDHRDNVIGHIELNTMTNSIFFKYDHYHTKKYDMINFMLNSCLLSLIYPGKNEKVRFETFNDRNENKYRKQKNKDHYFLKVIHDDMFERCFYIYPNVEYRFILNPLLSQSKTNCTENEIFLIDLTKQINILNLFKKQKKWCLFHYNSVDVILNYAGVFYLNEKEKKEIKERKDEMTDFISEWKKMDNIFSNECRCQIGTIIKKFYHDHSKNHQYIDIYMDDDNMIEKIYKIIFNSFFSLTVYDFGMDSKKSNEVVDYFKPNEIINIPIQILNGLPSDHGSVCGFGIFFPTLQLIERYKYRFDILFFPALDDKTETKYKDKKFYIWNQTKDGRKQKLFKFKIFQSNADERTLYLDEYLYEKFKHSERIYYGDIDDTDWGMCNIIEYQTLQQIDHDEKSLKIFVDERYEPEKVKSLKKQMLIESKIKQNINALSFGASSSYSHSNDVFFVFVLNIEQNETNDELLLSKIENNLIFKDQFIQKTFVIELYIHYEKKTNLMDIFNDNDRVDLLKCNQNDIYFNPSKRNHFAFVIHPDIKLEPASTVPSSMHVNWYGEDVKKVKKTSTMRSIMFEFFSYEQMVRMNVDVKKFKKIDVSTNVNTRQMLFICNLNILNG